VQLKAEKEILIRHLLFIAVQLRNLIVTSQSDDVAYVQFTVE